MNRVSDEETASVIWDVLSSLLQIVGFFVAFAGFWITVFDLAEGLTVSLNWIGPTILITGAASFFAGERMQVAEARRIAQSYLLPPTPGPSLPKVVSTPRLPRKASCPSCGYENEDAIFCIACNSPMWLAGKSAHPPPARSVVLRRRGRVVTMRKIKRITILSILAFVVSIPLVTNFVVGESAMNESKLAVALDYNSLNPSTNGTLYVRWFLYSPGFDSSVSENGPVYTVMFNSIQQPAAGCANPQSDSPGLPGLAGEGCDITVQNVNGTQLNGTTILVRVTLVARMYLLKQQVTRSISVLCDSRCTVPNNYTPWFI